LHPLPPLAAAQVVRRHQIVSQGVQIQYGPDLCEAANEQVAKASGFDVRAY